MTNITTPRVKGGRRAARICLVLALCLCFFAAAVCPVSAASVYPAATDYIADDAAVLSESTVREIKEKNDALISDVEAVIAVCTVKSTNGVDIGKYARSVYTEWKLPAGVLILIASEDNAFFLVQSASISEKITNAALEEIRDRDIEEDFAAGQIDRAVRKAVSQLSILMLRELKTDGNAAAPNAGNTGTAAAQRPGTGDGENQSGESGGKSILGLIWKTVKIILIVALVLFLLFVLLFVAALFNDDAAAFMQKTFFRKNSQRSGQNPPSYYDDRLYGDGRSQGGNRPRPNGQNGYPRQNGQIRPQNQGQYRNPYQGQNQYRNPNQAQAYGQQGYYQNQQAAGQGQYPQQAQYPQQTQYQQQYSQQAQYPQQVQGQYRQNGQYAQQRVRPQNQQNVYYNADGTVRQPRQQVPQQQAPRPRPVQNQYRQSAQPYSAENDPNVLRQKQMQSGANDPTATQTYTIPGREDYR